MKNFFYRTFLILPLICPSLYAKDDVVGVLSYELAPFQEAWKGFQDAFNAPAEVIHLAKEPLHLHGEPRVIVAFGGKAALAKYPGNSTLIYCMAPGTTLNPTDHEGSITQISMMPQPALALDKILLIQPTLKSMVVLWISPSSAAFIEALRRAGHARGIEIQSDRLTQASDLPNHLRQWQNKTNALWIPPDPLLITEQNVVLLGQFSGSSNIPYYTSVAGLAEKGAVASIASSYAEIGAAAANVARSVLQGNTPALDVYADKTDTILNVSAAEKVGLHIDAEQQKQFQKVIP